jgi:RING finger/CHY zinc finger protein 1
MTEDCSRFKSNCLIFAECCEQYYCCWKCHKSKTDHVLFEWRDISHVKCRKCDALNLPSNKCHQCQIQFNEYYCDKCVFWHNIPTSFHCDDCSMCYEGKREDFIHCQNCDICVPKIKWDIHRCDIINDETSDCPLCLENLHTFKLSNFILPCGHTMHQKCYNDYKENITDKNKLKCLFCFRLIEEINEEIRQKQNHLPVPSAPPFPL